MRGEDGRGHIASRNTERLPCMDAEPLDVKLPLGDRELNQCPHIQCLHLL